MIPSAARIVKDMKSQEKKFYERFLSSGYKLCECQICQKLELKFLIKEDNDPNDFIEMHREYLNKKINRENIPMKEGVYQNHTIILLNKESS